MGQVYLADDPGLERQVAIKVLPIGAADSEGRARFSREAQALARTDHENVVQVFASGEDQGVSWMSLEYVAGRPLSDLVAHGPLDEETALLLCAQAARGLAAVHAVGVVHRDVKPANLLLDESGTVRVSDFGVALFLDVAGKGGFTTQKGIAVGTPHFMSPEQARGETVDGRADTWALGCTLFMLLTGRPPFYAGDDESDLDILARVLREAAPDLREVAPAASRGTARLLAAMLARDRDERPDDLDDLADALEDQAAALADENDENDDGDSDRPADRAAAPAPEAAPPGAVPVPAAPPSRAAGVLLASAGVLLVALAALLLWVGPADQDPGGAGPRAPDPTPPGEAAPPGDDPLRIGAPDAPPATPPDAPPPDDGSTPDRWVAAIQRGGPAADAAVVQLLAREDDAAKNAVLQLVDDDRTAAFVVRNIGAGLVTAHFEALVKAVQEPDVGTAQAAVRALGRFRTIRAHEVLSRTAETHPDKAVRDAAQQARKAIFSVEGE